MLNKEKTRDVLRAMFGLSQSVTFGGECWLGLSLSEPVESSASATGTSTATTITFTEPTSANGYNIGYKRKLIGKNGNTEASLMGHTNVVESGTNEYINDFNNRKIRNGKMIMFDMFTGSTAETAKYYLLFASESATTPYAWGKLTSNIPLDENHVVVFKTDNLELSLLDKETVTGS